MVFVFLGIGNRTLFAAILSVTILTVFVMIKIASWAVINVFRFGCISGISELLRLVDTRSNFHDCIRECKMRSELVRNGCKLLKYETHFLSLAHFISLFRSTSCRSLNARMESVLSLFRSQSMQKRLTQMKNAVSKETDRQEWSRTCYH